MPQYISITKSLVILLMMCLYSVTYLLYYWKLVYPTPLHLFFPTLQPLQVPDFLAATYGHISKFRIMGYERK